VPDLRAIVVSLGVGAGVAGYFMIWWHWPLIVGGGVGILLGGLALVGTMAAAHDPADDDAAWRAAAPEFTDPRAGPSPGTSSRTRGPDRGHDRPSGD
jgi:hypothetical protein